jgi:multidrug efflux pump subunit AcrA (membrane-fusion protein)
MSNQGVGVSAMSSLLEPPDVQRFEQDLEGRIVLASPPGWKAYGGLLALTAAISGLAAGTVSIEKSVLISGKIIPMGGDVEVSHMSEGYVSEIRVRPGQSVRKGDILIVMANERAGRDGGDVSGGLREQMEIQAQAVERQISGLGENFAAQTDELETRRIAAAEAIESYQRRLALSTQRHELVESQVRQMQSLVDRGFGARLELDRRREVLLLASQDLEQAGAQLSAARRDYDAVGSQLRVIRARERAEAATLSSSLADVRERIALRSLEDGEAVRAPVSGVVSSVSTRTGRRPSGNDSLITLKPNGNGLPPWGDPVSMLVHGRA